MIIATIDVFSHCHSQSCACVGLGLVRSCHPNTCIYATYICRTRPTSCHAKKVALGYHHAVTTCLCRTRPYSCYPNKCIQAQHRATRITVVPALICCCLLVSNEANIVLPENQYRPLIVSCRFFDCCCRLCFQQRLRPPYKLSDDVWISRMEDRWGQVSSCTLLHSNSFARVAVLFGRPRFAEIAPRRSLRLPRLWA